VLLNKIFAATNPELIITEKHLVQLPFSGGVGNFLDSFHLPDWFFINQPKIYVTAMVIAIVASIESLLSVEAADKIDEEGRTISERMGKVEYQLWENGGSSMKDQMNETAELAKKTAVEVGFIKQVMLHLVELPDLSYVKESAQEEKAVAILDYLAENYTKNLIINLPIYNIISSNKMIIGNNSNSYSFGLARALAMNEINLPQIEIKILVEGWEYESYQPTQIIYKTNYKAPGFNKPIETRYFLNNQENLVENSYKMLTNNNVK
jgi:hypothetical protein